MKGKFFASTKVKLGVVLIVVVLIVAAIAAGWMFPYNPVAAPTITLVMMHHHGAPYGTPLIFETWVDGFFNAYYNYTRNIVVKYLPIAWGNYALEIKNLYSANKLPDIVHYYVRGDLIEAGIFDLPPSWVIEDVKKNWPQLAWADGAAAYKGQIYGYPTEYVNYALGYNKRLLAEAGFDHPPRTLEEFWEMAKACTKYDPKTGKMIQAGFIMPVGWINGISFNWELWLEAYGGELLSADGKSAMFNDEKGLAALKIIYDLFYTYKVCNPHWTANYLDYIVREKAAMWIPAAQWQARVLYARMGENVTHLGVAAIPAPPGGRQVVFGDFLFVGVNSKSIYKEEAWRFLKWLSEPGHPNSDYPGVNYSRIGWYEVTKISCYPSRSEDIRTIPELREDKWMAEFLKVQEYAILVSGKGTSRFEEMNKIIADKIERVIFEALDPQEALNLMEIEINDLLSGS